MANRDPAFLWETEALRTSPTAPPGGEPSAARRGHDWLTLRAASDVTGIPVSTLRNWSRKRRIPTALEETPSGRRRMVSLDGVRARAAKLGHVERKSGPGADETAPAPRGPRTPADQVSPPPGTMLVPIEAWDKMLLQLGNLHQAGQQLAEARERAARAETEAAFLRERLAELREAREPAGESPIPDPDQAEPQATANEQEPGKRGRMPSLTAYLWRLAVSDRRRK